MNNIFKIFFSLTLLWNLASCSKEDSDVFIPGPIISGADTNWTASVGPQSPVQELRQSLMFSPRVDSCEATANTNLQFSDGLQLYIPANAFTQSGGQTLTGKLQVEAMLIRKKGDMVRLDKPSVSYQRQLISAGEVYINVKKNGQELQLAQGKKIGISFNEPVTGSIRAFRGDDVNFERFNWIESSDTVIASSQGTSHYELSSSVLRWVGLHAYADTSGQRIALEVSLAPNFTNANTSIYLIYKDVRSVLGIYGNPVTKKFISSKLPIGKQATLVVLSKQGANSYYLSKDNITIGFNSPASANQVLIPHPQPTSMTDIKAFLETL